MDSFDKMSKIGYNDVDKSVDQNNRSKSIYPDNNLLTIEETSSFLRIKRNTLYKLINAREIISIKIGRRRFVSRKDLDNFIESRRTEFVFREEIQDDQIIK